ncbi:MAG: hypothetical protein LBN02_09720, partial [Oscillospiraceae bacterium]|nr:hypothetical protein [Oscillospiraceae bacterium]
MIGDFERFDLARKPNAQRRFLTPVTWALSYPGKFRRHSHIEKTDMAGIKPPYLLLCNHNAFFDFKVMTAAIFPHRANYVVAIDGFIGREWLLRSVGGIGVRKFTNSVHLVRNMMHMRDKKQIIALFPEARYSLCGTAAVLPDSLGKLIRLLDIPVVMLIMHGHHIVNPVWGEKKRKTQYVSADMNLLLSREQIHDMTAAEINDKLRGSFVYDDFAWQRSNGVRVARRDRAQGLHKVLYKCPSCGTEYRMNSGGDGLWCDSCGKHWHMSELGVLSADSGLTEFSHIPDWYEWERREVRGEIERGEYALSVDARVESLPNARGFVKLGEARLTHNMDGFTLRGTYDGEEYEETWKPVELYSCHIEYNY